MHDGIAGQLLQSHDGVIGTPDFRRAAGKVGGDRDLRLKDFIEPPQQVGERAGDFDLVSYGIGDRCSVESHELNVCARDPGGRVFPQNQERRCVGTAGRCQKMQRCELLFDGPMVFCQHIRGNRRGEVVAEKQIEIEVGESGPGNGTAIKRSVSRATLFRQPAFFVRSGRRAARPNAVRFQIRQERRQFGVGEHTKIERKTCSVRYRSIQSSRFLERLRSAPTRSERNRRLSLHHALRESIRPRAQYHGRLGRLVKPVSR